MSMARLSLIMASFVLPNMGSGAPEPAAKMPTVFIETVKRMPLFDILTYPARVVPKINAMILSEVDGIVTQIHAGLGRKARQGQKIMTLAHTDPVYQYAPVTVTSPVGGVVGQVEVTEGSRVTKGQKLATITDPGKVRIQMELAGSDLEAVKTGLAGELSFPGRETEVSVHVLGVSPNVGDTGTATVELEVTPPAPQIPLPPGLIGRVSFKVRDHQGLQIPESAVVYRGNHTLVRVVQNKRAKFVPITLGPARRGMVEIQKGIENGDEVIVRASTYVSNGDEVLVQENGLPNDRPQEIKSN